MRKGVSLSIRYVVIIAVAVIALFGVLGAFTGVWQPGARSIECQAEFQSGCSELLVGGCRSPSPKLIAAAACLGIDVNDIAEACGCEDVTPITPERIDILARMTGCSPDEQLCKGVCIPENALCVG
jgi:hypothetical protein